MAKSQNSVTSAQADNVTGPVLYNSTVTEVTPTTNFTTGGWKAIGYGSTDGISVEQKADDKDKTVWGSNLGTTYSNFKDVLTLHLASFADQDALGVIFGSDNVSTTAEGYTKVSVKSRQGTRGTFVVLAKTDDGRSMTWIYNGQTDPNVSYDATESDIITVELKVTGIADANGQTSYFFIKNEKDNTTPTP